MAVPDFSLFPDAIIFTPDKRQWRGVRERRLAFGIKEIDGECERGCGKERSAIGDAVIEQQLNWDWVHLNRSQKWISQIEI